MIQINQEVCAGCGECIDVCTVGAIQLVDYQAAIDHMLCTQCEACVDACPNGAITAHSTPVQSAALTKLPAAASPSIPTREQVLSPEALPPVRGLVPLAGAALAFLGREAAPHLVDVVVTALERRLTQTTTTTVSPLSTASRDFTTHNRGQRRQIRQRKGCAGDGNQRGRRR